MGDASDFNYEVQSLANVGQAVADFNQLVATAGYGQAHGLGIYHGKHPTEFEEIMLGVDDWRNCPMSMGARGGVGDS
ncbi:hypothetical protein ACFLTC_02190 [Chloroflexota bacterium]